MDFRTQVFAVYGHTMCYIVDDEVNHSMIAMHKMDLKRDQSDMNTSEIFPEATLASLYSDLYVFLNLIDATVLALENDDNAAIDENATKLDMQVMQFNKDVLALVNQATEEMDTLIGELSNNIVATKHLLLTVVTIIAIFGAIYSITLASSITKPIKRMTEVAEAISSGKQDVEFLNIERSDEIGTLAKSFNRMINSMQIAMKIINEQEK
jgi:methyl-accepting chemotaxis protein